MSRQPLVRLLVLTLGLGVASARSGHAQWRPDGAIVCGAANTQDRPAIIPDGAGGAIIAWEDFRSGTSYDIYAQRLDAAGVPLWTADGVPLCLQPGDQEYPAIVPDGAGGAIVAWEDERDGNADIYAQRVSADGNPVWPADGVPLCSAPLDQIHPAIAADGVGGAIAVWEDLRADNGSGLYVQRVNAAGTAGWTPNGVALMPAAGTAIRYPQIVSDGAEGAVVVWEEARISNWDVYARRVTADGVPIWTPSGVPLSIAEGDQYYTAITSDGAGGAIAVWEDGRSLTTSWDIYAQRVDVYGTATWGTDGVAVCTAEGGQEYPTIVADGEGGAIITWFDYRASNSDIYAQWVNGGTAEWSLDGVPLCTRPGTQEYPQIVSNDAGGAIVTWFDLRSGAGVDIYAQDVSTAGTPQWTPDGVGVCTNPSLQDSPKLAPDGAGGAIVVWQDSRSGNIDLYAQRIHGAGDVAAVPPSSNPPRFQMLPLAPNPTRDQLTIRIQLPASARVSAQVLDLAGHRVRALATERVFSSGMQVLAWDGRNDAGVRPPAGVYFVEVRVGTHSETRRAVVIH